MATKGDTFGAWIRATRKRKKLFAKDCAAAAGADGPLWSRWEHDGARKDNNYQTSDMEAESVRRVAVGLGEPEEVVFAAWSQRLQKYPLLATYSKTLTGPTIHEARVDYNETLDERLKRIESLLKQIVEKQSNNSEK